jgi:hypothetical protein
MPLKGGCIASHNLMLLDVGACNICIYPPGGSPKKYMPGIKMLYFCDTFWMRRAYLVFSNGGWHTCRILINSLGSLPYLKPLNLESGTDQHYLYYLYSIREEVLK